MAERDIVLELIEQRKGDALRAEAADLDRLADRAEVANRSMSRMGDRSSALSKRIEEQTTKVRALASEIERTGGDKGLFREFATAERDLNKMQRVFKELANEAGNAGARVGTSFSTGLSSALSEAANSNVGMLAIAGGIIGAGTVAAPVIAGTVSAAVVAGLGAGGIAAGIAAAANDPAVQAASARFGDKISAQMDRIGEGFKGPLIEALDNLGDHAATALGGLNLGRLTPQLTELSDGLSGFIDNVLPGLVDGLEAAQPVLDELARDLPGLGSAVGDAFSSISEHSDDLVTAMRGAFTALDGLIRGTGATLGWLTARLGDMAAADRAGVEHLRSFNAGLKDFGPSLVDSASGANNLLGALGGLSTGMLIARQHTDATTFAAEQFAHAAGERVTPAAHESAAAMAAAAVAAQIQADAMRRLDDALFDNFNRQLAAASAALAYQGDILGLKAAVDSHGTSMSNNTEAGVQNQQMLLTLANEALHTRDANIAAGMGADEANAKYRQQVIDLQNQAIKLGLSEDKVNDLIGALKNIPTRVTTEYVLKYTEMVGAPGEHSGARIADTNRRASGGPVSRGVPYIVGENRPEVFVPDQNGHIEPRVPAVMGGRSSGGSGGTRTLAPLRGDPGSFAATIVDLLQTMAQRQYGGDAVLMLSVKR